MDYVVFSCKLCPHHQEEAGVYDDYCDCEGNCCDEGCFLLTWNEKEKRWLSEDRTITLHEN